MRASGRGETGTQLPWLAPGAASLVALCTHPAPDAWRLMRGDPGAVLLLLRSNAPFVHDPGVAVFPSLLQEPTVHEEALRLLDQPRFVDWSQPEVQPIYRASLTYATLASHLANQVKHGNPETAWATALLAPLGWLASCAMHPDLVRDCLDHSYFARKPEQVQTQLWGLDQATLTRRLARSWRLPGWLGAVLGHLGIPCEIAQTLGADPVLFRVVQLAVTIGQQHGVPLQLAVGEPQGKLAASLGLSDQAIAEAECLARDLLATPGAMPDWQPPSSHSMLGELLLLAAENRRLQNAPLQEQLEDEVDNLHRALQAKHAATTEQLREQKLSALAEFAAGAGHEINNPLAVISGQAQYLLRGEQEPGRQQALEKIIGQTHRVHDLLRDLMQFARPPRPQIQRIEILDLVREVLTSHQDQATERKVRLVYPIGQLPLYVHADPGQLRVALTCLLRNAIEAAGGDGWAGIQLHRDAPDQVDLVVEDSGPGPSSQQREHLFDPFFSGRQAGRGRGLGLPTAWRLAREQGGDVRLLAASGSPTRFVLSLPFVETALKEPA